MISIEDGKKLIQILNENNYSSIGHSEEHIFYKLFYNISKISLNNIPEHLASYFNELLEKSILQKNDHEIWSQFRIVPFHKNHFFVDSPSVASTGTDCYLSNKEDHYGYIGRDGMMLANYIFPKLKNKHYHKGLDLCTGSGIIGITFSKHFDSIEGVDIDQAAIKWAQLNSQINSTDNYKPSSGDLYIPVKDKKPFDVVFANPSYSFYPPEIKEKYKIRDYEESGNLGLALTIKIIEGFDQFLTEQGEAYICTTAPIKNGKDYLIQQLHEKFSNKDYSFKIYYTHQLTINEENKEYYNTLGVNKMYFVYITVKKGEPFTIIKEKSKMFYFSHLPRNMVPQKVRHFIKKTFLSEQ